MGGAVVNDVGQTDAQRLIQLFDAVVACHCTLTVFAYREPAAPATLRSWAAARGFAVLERAGKGYRVLAVELDTSPIIDVHLEPVC